MRLKSRAGIGEAEVRRTPAASCVISNTKKASGTPSSYPSFCFGPLDPRSASRALDMLQSSTTPFMSGTQTMKTTQGRRLCKA